MLSNPPHGLGYPNDTAVLRYYLGDRVTREGIAAVAKLMQERGSEPENMRLRKDLEDGKVVYEVLQVSSETDILAGSDVCVVRGDHTAEMSAICTQ
jgi:hypothetical protein